MTVSQYALAAFTAVALLVAAGLAFGVLRDGSDTGVPGITSTGTTTEVDR